MDRRTVLERLDAVRPGSDDLALPELAGVSDALARDGSLAVELRRRQALDRRVAEAMWDVPVPGDLKDRLLARLAETSSVPATSRARRIDRRGLLGTIAASAAAVIAAAVFWIADGVREPVTLVELRDAAASALAQNVPSDAFRGGFTPRPPAGGWLSRLRFEREPLGLLPENGEHRAVAWRFAAGRGGTLRGILVAVPVEGVISPPDADSPYDRHYVAGNAVAWTEGGFVYVCSVNGPIDELLRRVDDGRLA